MRSRALRIVFAVVGSLAAILAIATVGAALIFYTPTSSPHALWGSLLYFGIAVVSWYAFFRLRRSALDTHRGFDVVIPEREQPLE